MYVKKGPRKNTAGEIDNDSEFKDDMAKNVASHHQIEEASTMTPE